MDRNLVFVFITLVVGLTVPFVSGSAAANTADALQSFYIISHVVSDAAPLWFDYVLDVRPINGDTVIQDIRIAPLNSYCPRPVTVKAVQRIVPGSRVRSLAKLSLCSLQEAAVASAIKAATPAGNFSIDDAVRFTIVAKCGATDKVFELPFPETVDLKLLKQTTPSVAALWSLANGVTRRAFGKSFSFYGVSSGQDAEFQELGSKIVPGLKYGKYDRGFASDRPLSSVLQDYIGPVADRDPASVQLEGVSPSQLEKYIAPEYPKLAKEARIEGEVVLQILIDTISGTVRSIGVTSGHPLLVSSAIAAARQWQFHPDAQLKQPTDVRVKFEFLCPSPEGP